MKKKNFKRVVAWISAITMVVSSLTGLNLTNIAADTTTTVIATGSADRTALLTEITNADYNFALGKDATVSNQTFTDGATNLGLITNGAFPKTSTNKVNVIEIGRGSKDNTWVQVDLGKAYDATAIDRVEVQYKTNNSGPKGGYKVQYSLNGVDYIDIATIGALAGSNCAIYEDKISMTDEQKTAIPYAKYIRIYSTTDSSAYGLQVMSMAVLTNGTTKVSEVGTKQLDTLENPASVTVTSSDYEQLEYEFEGVEGHEDYTYYAYINGAKEQNEIVPGQKYTKTGLSAGEYTVKIVSYKNGVSSDGISQTITVNDTKSLLTDSRNFAIGKTAVPSSNRGEAADIISNLTDGKLTTMFRTATTDTTANVVIDLGNYYKLEALERVVLLYNTGRYAKNISVDYSINGIDYQSVGSAEGTSELQSCEMDSSKCIFSAVRYVRINFDTPVTANYGFQIYEIGVITKPNADLTPVEVSTVNDPADFIVEATGYNKVSATITAGTNQEDYKYSIYIDGKPILINKDAGTYTIDDIAPGDHTFTVKSVFDNVTSEGITKEVTVESGFDYSYETLTNSNVESGRSLDNEITINEKTCYNYSRYKKVNPTALSNETDLLTPDKAIDGLDNTRWASAQGIDEQWYQLDLGSQYKIDELQIVWQTSSAKDYNIEVSTDGVSYTRLGLVTSAKVGARYDKLTLTDETTARYVRINGTARNSIYGYSIWEIGVYGPDQRIVPQYEVKVDGTSVGTYEEDDEFTLGNAAYGYYADGKMYEPNTKYVVNSDVDFTSVTELSVTAQTGAGLRYVDKQAGLRFQMTATSNVEGLIEDTNVISEGTLITAYDLYTEKGQNMLDLNSKYTVINVINTGWYDPLGDNHPQVGTYCGSISNIADSNYIRNFVARGYATIKYANGNTLTVYSNMTGVRTVKGIAQAVINHGYPGIADEYKTVIDAYAAAK